MEHFDTLLVVAVIGLLCRLVGVSRVASTVALLGLVSTLARHLDKQNMADMSDNFLWTGMVAVDSQPDTPTALSMHELLDLDPVELIHYYGYPADYHWVTTPDGYILGLHRIPHGPNETADNGNSSSPRPAVLMVHPLLACSADWILSGPGKSLAFMLADEGYDVWLFNARGNSYSRNHTTLSPDNDVEFWNFSFHEHGTLDIPTAVEYVLNVTGRPRLQYVGFSMGTTAVWVLGSLRPDVAAKLTMVTALGPVRDAGHASSSTARLVLNSYFMSLYHMMNYNEFMPKTTFLKRLSEMFCMDGQITQVLCARLVSSVSGRNDAQFNRTLMPLIFSRTPAGTSLKNIDHFKQTLVSGSLRQFDYGEEENIKRYGTPQPPAYDTNKMSFPIRIHYGMNDLLAYWKDAEEMCATFPHVLSCDRVSDPLWNHLDFVWGIDAADMVYKKVVADIKASDALVARDDTIDTRHPVGAR